jgi:putative oxidoreductase
MVSNSEKHMLGHTLLRVTIGLLFLIAGINKIKDPSGIIGMLGGIGFPIATFFGWLLILSEIVFGALILIGYKVKVTAWPLAIILAVAWILVTVPNGGLTSSNSFFHLIGIAGLVTIALTGPGKWAISKGR